MAFANTMTNGDPREQRERARDERRGPIVLKVEYKRLNTFFYDYTKNISKGGTFIKTDRPLNVGTMFLFRLTMPGSSEAIELRGEVRWVLRPGEPPPPEAAAGQEPGMGIRFIFGDPAERTGLEHTVERIMVESLGYLAYSRLLAAHADGGGVDATTATDTRAAADDKGNAGQS